MSFKYSLTSRRKKFPVLFGTMLFAFCTMIFSASLIADSLNLPAGVPTPSFANNMIVVDDINNGNDVNGYGNVPYEYRVSRTQITVGDWVDFLNAVDPFNNLNLQSSYTHKNAGWASWIPYQHNGSSWSVKSPYNNGVVELSASDAARLPVDGISLNQVARYMNWLATGDINQGAFTFSGTNGNSNIATFDHTYPGPRLPLEDELYKAMYWHKGISGYRLYPNGSNSPPSKADVDTSTADYITGSSTALFGSWDFATGPSSNSAWAKVGQETSGNPWGFYDMSGNRHETTLELNQSMAQLLAGATGTPTGSAILRGASGFDTPIAASRSDWRNPAGSNNGGGSYTISSQEPSIGFRVWTGVPVPSGRISIKKEVTGGTDSQTFSLSLDCPGTNHDVNNILLTDGSTYTTPNTIPAGTQCAVSETTPTAPAGYTYGSPVISPSPVTVGDGNTVLVTVTNPLQPDTGSLDVRKLVTGAPAGFTSPDYSITVDCDGTSYDQTFNLKDGENNLISNIPNGTVCTVVEAAQPAPPAGYEYGTAVYSPATANSSGVTINGGSTVTVTVTNPLAQGCSISAPTIVTSCDDNGTPTVPADDTFTFTINANGVAVGSSYSVTAPAGVGLSPNPTTGLSYTTTSAALSGPFTITDGSFTIDLTDVDDNSCTRSATVTPPVHCSNTQVGSLQISKVVTGKPAGFSSPDYSITIDCDGTTYDQAVTLKDGESITINNIAENTVCNISEPVQPTPPAGYEYGTPVLSPSSVTIQGNNTVSVTVNNPLAGICKINTPSVSTQCYHNGTATEDDDTFSFKITTTGDFTANTYSIDAGSQLYESVPYDLEAGSFGDYLITGGDINLTLIDDDKASCQLSAISVTAPQPCSTTAVCTLVTNTASVSAINETDANTSNNSDGVVHRVNCDNNPEIDLDLVKTVDKASGLKGETLTYTLTLKNTGADDATEVLVNEKLPAELNYVSSTPSQGGYDPDSGDWRVGYVASGGQASLTLVATIK
jgi:uncharacterized repeat protein (TIGR01451 family)